MIYETCIVILSSFILVRDGPSITLEPLYDTIGDIW
jgi:hypothetical protein